MVDSIVRVWNKDGLEQRQECWKEVARGRFIVIRGLAWIPVPMVIRGIYNWVNSE